MNAENTVRMIIGIIGVLVAVFAGGCGLVFFFNGMKVLFSGQPDYGITLIALLAGILPGLLGGLVAWWAFKRRQ